VFEEGDEPDGLSIWSYTCWDCGLTGETPEETAKRVAQKAAEISPLQPDSKKRLLELYGIQK